MPGCTLRALAPALIAAACLASPVAAQVTSSANVAPTALIRLKPLSGVFAPLVTDPAKTFSEPTTSRPDYLVPVLDPTFALPVTRITGNAGTAFGNGVAGNWGTDARQHYSKDQPWNADGSLLAIQPDGGGMVLLDGESYQPLKGKCSSYSMSDDRWHPSPAHARERINVNGSELMWYDVVNCVKTRSWKLPYAVQYFGEGEGNPSFDGRYVALTNGTRMFVVDMDPQAPFAPYPAQRIGPSIDINDPDAASSSVDWVSVSPSGKYVVVSYDGDHPRVYDVNPNTLALTPRPMPDASPRCTGTGAQGYVYDLGHADMTLNPFDNNEDVLIGQEHCGNRGRKVNGQLIGGVVMTRLSDGKITPLTDANNEAYPHHISTRNYDRPGWVYVGYHVESGKKYSDEIVAVKLDGSKTVQRFADKHSEYNGCYRCEAHSVPSRDGRRVLWASNWSFDGTGSSTSDIKAYVVDARAAEASPVAHSAPWFVTVDASGSKDSDGHVASYRFDFGDGTVTPAQISPYAAHLYRAGVWTLKVTVTDDAGSGATATQTVDVSGGSGLPPVNDPPFAALAVTPTTGTAPLAVTLDGSASSDDQGAIASYQFDFGDGTSVTGMNPQATHTYAAGRYLAILTVTDAGGLSGTSAQWVVANAAPVDTTAVGGNLVRNASFEADMAGWKGYWGGTISRVPGGEDGAWSLAVHSAPGSKAEFGVNDSPSWVQKTPVLGARYRFSAWVRGEGDIRFQVREYLLGVQLGRTMYSSVAHAGADWQQITLDVTSTGLGSMLDFQVIDTPSGADQTFDLDAVSIATVVKNEAEAPSFARPAVGFVTPLAFAPRLTENPMHGAGAIELGTAVAGPLRASLFDAAGRRVRVLSDDTFAPAGTHHLPIDGRDQSGAPLGAGVYFYEVESTLGRSAGRVVLVK